MLRVTKKADSIRIRHLFTRSSRHFANRQGNTKWARKEWLIIVFLKISNQSFTAHKMMKPKPTHKYLHLSAVLESILLTIFSNRLKQCRFEKTNAVERASMSLIKYCLTLHISRIVTHTPLFCDVRTWIWSWHPYLQVPSSNILQLHTGDPHYLSLLVLNYVVFLFFPAFSTDCVQHCSHIDIEQNGT